MHVPGSVITVISPLASVTCVSVPVGVVTVTGAPVTALSFAVLKRSFITDASTIVPLKARREPQAAPVPDESPDAFTQATPPLAPAL